MRAAADGDDQQDRGGQHEPGDAQQVEDRNASSAGRSEYAPEMSSAGPARSASEAAGHDKDEGGGDGQRAKARDAAAAELAEGDAATRQVTRQG